MIPRRVPRLQGARVNCATIEHLADCKATSNLQQLLYALSTAIASTRYKFLFSYSGDVSAILNPYQSITELIGSGHEPFIKVFIAVIEAARIMISVAKRSG